jgi:hypothetical protein
MKNAFTDDRTGDKSRVTDIVFESIAAVADRKFSRRRQRRSRQRSTSGWSNGSNNTPVLLEHGS